eukprot:11168456-Lingulodinium_polyedra.AAC.1
MARPRRPLIGPPWAGRSRVPGTAGGPGPVPATRSPRLVAILPWSLFATRGGASRPRPGQQPSS